MNVPGTTGESSCKRQENGDGPVEPDRPLKKARFAWQVKGKYHLKNETCESNTTNTMKDSAHSSSSSQSPQEQKDLVGNTEQNLEILGDYLLKQDFNTLDAITDSDKIVLPSTSSEKLQYPRYVSSFESSSSKDNRSSDDENSATPISLLHSNSYSEDQCIARWQARQMAKCFVDNTINRVLDNWMIAPLPAEVDNNRFLALDVAEFINNLPGDNTIENEGILMAISAHGLQNTSTSSNQEGEKKQSSNKDMFNTPPCSPVPSEDFTTNSNNNNDPSSSSELDMSWSYDDEAKPHESNDMQFSYFPSHSSSYKYYGENELDSSTINNDENTLNCDNVMDNYDFLDTAVTFAIQNKGLASFGSEYG
ncbi:uncharacterized protein LOC123707690 [Pieris brassicae]|uniref:Uncharacterized protein n=1 Tax=Pieris brassicae TaxID=7116 RepID=A0A9P0TBW0_PIEBR|nr:uncharacterized protein LOC123707690 [Pieris brassicae]CAH4022330.1 unnamed protein product [Pieris brassicae]